MKNWIFFRKINVFSENGTKLTKNVPKITFGLIWTYQKYQNVIKNVSKKRSFEKNILILKFSLKISRIKKLLRKGKKYENKLYHNSWGSTNCICGSNLLSFGLSQNIKWHQIRLDSIYTSNFIFLVQIEHFLEHLRITWYSFCHISHSWSPKKPSESLIWSILIDNGVEFILKSVP